MKKILKFLSFAYVFCVVFSLFAGCAPNNQNNGGGPDEPPVSGTYYTVDFDMMIPATQLETQADKITYTSVEPQQVLQGDKATVPETPTLSYVDPWGKTYNFVFENWYKGDSVYNFNTPVMSDITLRAKWTLENEFFAPKQNAEKRAEGTNLRIMSYNLLADDWNNKPPVDQTRISGVVGVMNRYCPDVVMLQECDDEWYAALDTNLENYKFVNYPDNNKLTYKNKLTTVYCSIIYCEDVLKLEETWSQYYSNADNGTCRLYTVARFTIKSSGKQVICIATHWSLSQYPERQAVQGVELANLINSLEEQFPEVPVIVGGDLNSIDNGSGRQELEQISGHKNARNAVDIGLLIGTSHCGIGMVEKADRDVNNPEHWLLGKSSLLPQNIMIQEAIDNIFIPSFVTSLYYDTVVDEATLNASDHCPVYCDIIFYLEDKDGTAGGFDGEVDRV